MMSTFSKLYALKVVSWTKSIYAHEKTISYCTGNDFVRNYWGHYPHLNAFYIDHYANFQELPVNLDQTINLCFRQLKLQQCINIALFTEEKNIYYSLSKNYLDLPEPYWNEKSSNPTPNT